MTWTEVADQDTLDRLLGHRRPRQTPLSVETFKLPLVPQVLDGIAALGERLGDCPKRESVQRVLKIYMATCVNDYCACTEPGYIKITIERFRGREHIEVEVPTFSCGHPGNWDEASENEYVRGITTVRTVTDGWSQSRYPERQVWCADFHCGEHQ